MADNMSYFDDGGIVDLLNAAHAEMLAEGADVWANTVQLAITRLNAERLSSPTEMREAIALLTDVRDSAGCQPGYLHSLTLSRVTAFLAERSHTTKEG